MDHPARFWNVFPGNSNAYLYTTQGLYSAHGFDPQSIRWVSPSSPSNALFINQPITWPAANSPNAAAQIAALKKQLAEMRKTLQSLEAALQMAAPEQKDPEPKPQDSPKED